LRKVVIKQWRFQVGSAITFPFCGRTYILHKAPEMARCLLVHEQVHVAQIERMGTWGAVRGAIEQRNKIYGFMRLWSRDWIFGKETEMEREAYAAQRRCEEERE
jgi:hypothetical protein